MNLNRNKMATNNNVISFIAKAFEKGRPLHLPKQEGIIPDTEIAMNFEEEVDVFIFQFANDIVRLEIYKETEMIEVKYYDKESHVLWKSLELDAMSLGMLMHCFKEIVRINGNDDREEQRQE